MTKVEIIHTLAAVHNYRAFLEISTPVTGFMFAQIDASRFDLCHRLTYLCPNTWSDGAASEYKSPTNDISACLAEISRRGLRYDVILVDPWHEYTESARDIREAFSMLPAGGTMLVHDCGPMTWEMALPTPQPAGVCWSGVTYKAFLDFVLGRDDLSYLTIDEDYGCGVVTKTPRTIGDTEKALTEHWLEASSRGYEAVFDFFSTNRIALLKLHTDE